MKVLLAKLGDAYHDPEFVEEFRKRLENKEIFSNLMFFSILNVKLQSFSISFKS